MPPTVFYHEKPEGINITPEQISLAAVTAYMYSKPQGVPAEKWMQEYNSPGSYIKSFYIGLARHVLYALYDLDQGKITT